MTEAWSEAFAGFSQAVKAVRMAPWEPAAASRVAGAAEVLTGRWEALMRAPGLPDWAFVALDLAARDAADAARYWQRRAAVAHVRPGWVRRALWLPPGRRDWQV
ncbi:MAG TPA: hypothetical protein VGD67_25145 [Pseudonocardiaceae bacterium]